MALGNTLGGMLAMLKAEARLTQLTAAGLNADASLRQLLRRTQDDLWLEIEWPHLRVWRDITTQAGEQYYDLPADLDFNRIYEVKQKWNNLWRTVDNGIGEHEYNLYDPEQNRRTDPVNRWQLYNPTAVGATPTQQVELWPLPATSGIPVRFRGIQTIQPLVGDSDIAALDDTLLVLICAAEKLTEAKASDAASKSKAAAERLRRLIPGGIRKRFNFRGAHGALDPRFPNRDDDPFRIRVTYARAR